MINYETILSLFDDKLTLLEYLTKIEQALKNEQLTDITVTQTDASHVYFTFVFEDGSTIDTPTFTLPAGPQGIQGPQGEQGIQGEQGPAGADGADGVSVTGATINASNHLILTLSSGNTIDAGAIPNTLDVIDLGDYTIVTPTEAGTQVGTYTLTADQLTKVANDSNNVVLKFSMEAVGVTLVNYLMRTHTQLSSALNEYEFYSLIRGGNYYTVVINGNTGVCTITAWAQASGGTTLTQYTKASSNIADLVKILKNAKGNIGGWVQLKPTSSGNWVVSLPITCFAYGYSAGTAAVYYSFSASYTAGSDETRKGMYIADGYINISNAFVIEKCYHIKTDHTIEDSTFRFGSFYAIYFNDEEIT